MPSALVGQHLGTQQLGAVSVGSLAVTFCTFLFSFLLFLTTPEIAGAVAQRDPDKVSFRQLQAFHPAPFGPAAQATVDPPLPSRQVSKLASKSLWVAAACGALISLLAALGAESIIGCEEGWQGLRGACMHEGC